MKTKCESGKARSSKPGKNAKRKKGKKITRASLRALCESRLERILAGQREGKNNPICNTRTVEMTSSEACSEESSKLLFALALDLVPNLVAKPVKFQGPIVCMERLDPALEEKARNMTKARIIEVCERRARALKNNTQSNNTPCQIIAVPSRPLRSVAPEVPKVSNENVETIDLASSADEDEGVEEDMMAVALPSRTTFSKRLRSQESRNKSSLLNRPLITVSRHSPRTVFNPLLNNQYHGIFRKCNADLKSHHLNFTKTIGQDKTKLGPSQVKGFRSRVMSFLETKKLRSLRSHHKSISSVKYVLTEEHRFSLSVVGTRKQKYRIDDNAEDSCSSSGFSEFDSSIPEYEEDCVITLD